jgi:hypothetical protein
MQGGDVTNVNNSKSVVILFIYLFFHDILSSSQVRDLQSANARMTRHVQYVEVSQRKEIENIKAGLAQPMITVYSNYLPVTS